MNYFWFIIKTYGFSIFCNLFIKIISWDRCRQSHVSGLLRRSCISIYFNKTLVAFFCFSVRMLRAKALRLIITNVKLRKLLIEIPCLCRDNLLKILLTWSLLRPEQLLVPLAFIFRVRTELWPDIGAHIRRIEKLVNALAFLSVLVKVVIVWNFFLH